MFEAFYGKFYKEIGEEVSGRIMNFDFLIF